MPSLPPDLVTVGPGLLLRRPTSSDAPAMAGVVADSLEHLEPWMAWATPQAGTLAAQQERLAVERRAWDEGEEHHYLAVAGAEGPLLGRFGLHRRVGPAALEIGYWLRPDAVGKGYATACVRALTATALSLPDVVRVEIHCDEANVRSRRVALAAGYRLDRVEVEEVQAPGEVGRHMIFVFPCDGSSGAPPPPDTGPGA